MSLHYEGIAFVALFRPCNSQNLDCSRPRGNRSVLYLPPCLAGQATAGLRAVQQEKAAAVLEEATRHDMHLYNLYVNDTSMYISTHM